MATLNLPSLLLLILWAHGANGLITGIRLMTLATDTTVSGTGRVEVIYQNSWTSLCDDFWEDIEAGAVCRMLGFTTGPFVAIRNQDFYGTGSPLVLSVDCSLPAAASLNSCTQTAITPGSCSVEAAAVQCGPASPTPAPTPVPQATTPVPPATTPVPPATTPVPQATTPVPPATTPVPQATTPVPPATATPAPGFTGSPGSIGNCPPHLRLVANPGAYPGTGIVEVQHPSTGAWGTICDDLWDVQDATVVCRMCNYHLSSWWYPRPGAQGSDISGASSLALHLDDVECQGSETDVRSCPHRAWGLHNCNDWEKASVSCIQFNSSANASLGPDVDCSSDGMLVSFSRSHDPSLQPHHLTVNPPSGCASAVKSVNASHVNVFIPIRSCNMALIQNATHIIYQSVIHHATTDATIGADIYVRCEMSRSANLTRIYTPLREVANVSSAGAYRFTMKFFLNDSFSKEDPRLPLPIAIGEKLNVGIVLEGNHNNLEVIVHNCWTTPVPPSVSTVSQNLMINNCRVEPTLRTFPLNISMFGFRFQTYKFTTSNLIYVNCDAFACVRFINTSDCDQTCNNPKAAPVYPMSLPASLGRRRRDTSPTPQRYLVTSPPVYVYEPGQAGDLSDYLKQETMRPEVRISMPVANSTVEQDHALLAAALGDSGQQAQEQTLVLEPYQDVAMATSPALPLLLLALLAVLVLIGM